MPCKCEIWLGDAEKELGTYEFADVPRCGETVSLPVQDSDQFSHYKVDQITHRANSAKQPSVTYLFVSLVSAASK